MSNASYIYPGTDSVNKGAIINVIEEGEAYQGTSSTLEIASCERCGMKQHLGLCPDQCQKCAQGLNAGEFIILVALPETRAGFLSVGFAHQTCPE